MNIWKSISVYTFWLYLVMCACAWGCIAACQTGSSTAEQMKLLDTRRQYALITMQRVLFSCCFATTIAALVCSDWHVAGWKHGVLTLEISTRMPITGLALWLMLMCVAAVSTTLLIMRYAHVFLPSSPKKSFRKTRLIRKRRKPHRD